MNKCLLGSISIKNLVNLEFLKKCWKLYKNFQKVKLNKINNNINKNKNQVYKTQIKKFRI